LTHKSGKDPTIGLGESIYTLFNNLTDIFVGKFENLESLLSSNGKVRPPLAGFERPEKADKSVRFLKKSMTVLAHNHEALLRPR
jgi:hypothetical protein